MKLIVIFSHSDRDGVKLESTRHGSDFDGMRGEMSTTKDLYANEYSQKLVTGSAADENLDASVSFCYYRSRDYRKSSHFPERRSIDKERRDKRNYRFHYLIPNWLELASNNYLLKRFLRFVRWKLCGSPIKPSIFANNFQFSVM